MQTKKQKPTRLAPTQNEQMNNLQHEQEANKLLQEVALMNKEEDILNNMFTTTEPEPFSKEHCQKLIAANANLQNAIVGFIKQADGYNAIIAKQEKQLAAFNTLTAYKIGNNTVLANSTFVDIIELLDKFTRGTIQYKKILFKCQQYIIDSICDIESKHPSLLEKQYNDFGNGQIEDIGDFYNLVELLEYSK